MVYIEDAFTEQNIETATRKKSIYSLAKISGYEPYYGSAASGILNASLISNTNLSSQIKKIYIDNQMVRHFIPVRVGTTGQMYDKVSQTLFGNLGTGSFTLGPDVT